MTTQLATRTACPKCATGMKYLRPSPGNNPHIVAVYPCQCWITVDAARKLAAQIRAANAIRPEPETP